MDDATNHDVTGHQYDPNEPEVRHWLTDQSLVRHLYVATLTLLDMVEMRCRDEHMRFSEAIDGGGEIVCEMSDLDMAWAPVIEADAVRLVSQVSGLPAQSLFSPVVPHVLALIDRQPLCVQRDPVQRVGEAFVQQENLIPRPRTIAARSRTTIPYKQAIFGDESTGAVIAEWAEGDRRHRGR